MSNKYSQKALIVDDDERMRAMCTALLSSSGFEVTQAGNGLDALGILEHAAFDLIVSDINMPHLDGLRFYSQVIKDYPSLRSRFLFITSSTSADLQATFRKLGVKFLRKPFDPAEFLTCSHAVIVSSGGAPPHGNDLRKSIA